MPIGREAPKGPSGRYRVRLRAWRVGVRGRGSLDCRACGPDRMCWGAGQPQLKPISTPSPTRKWLSRWPPKRTWLGLCGWQDMRSVRQNSRRPVLGFWHLLARRPIPRISRPVYASSQPLRSTPSCAAGEKRCYDTRWGRVQGQPWVVGFRGSQAGRAALGAELLLALGATGQAEPSDGGMVAWSWDISPRRHGISPQ